MWLPVHFIPGRPIALFLHHHSIHTPPPTQELQLYRRRVKHDADGSTEGLWWEVVLELRPDDTGVACNQSSVGRLHHPLRADVSYRVAG